MKTEEFDKAYSRADGLLAVVDKAIQARLTLIAALRARGLGHDDPTIVFLENHHQHDTELRDRIAEARMAINNMVRKL